MEHNVKKFLESGKLELYVLGQLSANDQEEVQRLINQYPEINKEYQTLQDQLESLSLHQAKSTPVEWKNEILNSLPEKSTPGISSSHGYAFLIGLVSALLVITASGWYYSNKKVQTLESEFAEFKDECDQRIEKLSQQANYLAFMNDPETVKYNFEGNTLAPQFITPVFVNVSTGKLLLPDMQNMDLPKGKCLQMWGDLEGEMIPIAVIDNQDKSYQLDLSSDFASLNLTIEDITDDGLGQSHPDVTQLVSSISI